MKIILTDNKGTKIAERNVPDNTTIHDIICKTETVAAKIWLEDDIKAQLESAGFNPSKENVSAVINTGYLDRLNDCDDADWMAIDYAISFANDCGNLK